MTENEGTMSKNVGTMSKNGGTMSEFEHGNARFGAQKKLQIA